MKLVITFNHEFDLTFQVHDTSIAQRWADALSEGLEKYPLDDPKRFYGFDDIETEKAAAVERICQTIDIINAHSPIIDRKPYGVDDQDTLNYLHHIFEVYHGLLDQQTHPYYVSAPASVQKALADLNVDVHRCENALRNPGPRFTCTWYGLPKTRLYEPNDFSLLTNEYKFGDVYINYVEIGKTLEDLFYDNDNYIAPEAFRPLKHFSADFVVKFFDVDPAIAAREADRMWAYYYSHLDEFTQLGWGEGVGRAALNPGLIPVASLQSGLKQETILTLLQPRQNITEVKLVS